MVLNVQCDCAECTEEEQDGLGWCTAVKPSQYLYRIAVHLIKDQCTALYASALTAIQKHLPILTYILSVSVYGIMLIGLFDHM